MSKRWKVGKEDSLYRPEEELIALAERGSADGSGGGGGGGGGDDEEGMPN